MAGVDVDVAAGVDVDVAGGVAGDVTDAGAGAAVGAGGRTGITSGASGSPRASRFTSLRVWRNSGEISWAAVAFCRILSTPLATGPGADATIAATSAGDACSRSPDSNQLVVLDPPTLVTCSGLPVRAVRLVP